MVISCPPRAFRHVVWGAVLTLAICSIPAATLAADPFADSFASGGKKHPARRVTTKKKTTTKPARRSKPARPAHAKTRAKPRPGRYAAPSRAGEDANAGTAERADPPREEPRREEPQREEPQRDESDESPRARRAAEPEETPRAEEEGDRPKSRRAAPVRHSVTKRRKHTTDDDGEGDSDDDDATPYAAPTATQPVIVPRTFALLLGGTMMGRSFHFDAPLQRESSFPRIGYQAAIETYPLGLLGDTWLSGFGLAASYAAEVIGKASVSQTNGMSTSTSVKQSRWNLDLRYAFQLGGYVVLAPDVGLTSSSFTLSTNMPVMASQCVPTSTMACVPDTDDLLLQTGLHLRVAATRDLGITLDGAYLQALIVKNKPLNEIGYEAGTSANGFNAAVGATYLLTDFLSIHAEVPLTRLTYTFHNPPETPYKTATETYYGLNLGLSVFTD